MYKPMRFWGTGASGAIPSPFCKCEVCEHARRVGGKEVRMRSAFRIDEKVMIDIGEDFVPQAVRLEEDLTEVEHFLFTHTHGDHFNYRMFWIRASGAVKPPFPIKVYLVEDAYSYIEKFLYGTPILIDKNGRGFNEDNVIFEKLEYYKTYKINGMEVTPLKGNHVTTVAKHSANFLIRLKDERLMYYGLDTGLYPEKTVEYLKKRKLDILISECTFPKLRPFEKENNTGHMDIPGCIYMLDMLYKNETITENTKIYITHIAAKGLNHQQLEEYFTKLDRPYHVQIAYDGLSIDE